jgi:hypothetical protein
MASSGPQQTTAATTTSSSSNTGASGGAHAGLAAPTAASETAASKPVLPPLVRNPLFKTNPVITVVLQLLLGCTAAGCLALSLVVVLCLLLVMTCISDDSGLLFAVLQDLLLA